MQLFVGIVFTLVGVVFSATDIEQIEQTGHTVTMKFYNMKASEWDAVEDNFKIAVAKGCTQYCKENAGNCGLTGWDNSYAFTKEDIITTSQLKFQRYYLNVTYYVEYNGNVPANVKNNTQFVLNRVAVSFGSEAVIDDLNEQVGHSVVGIGSESYSPPPNSYMNSIMIPVGCVGLVLIPIIIVIACYCHKKRQDKKELRELRSKQIEGKKAEKKAKRGTEAIKHQGSSPGHKSKVAPEPGRRQQQQQQQQQQDPERGQNGTGHRDVERVPVPPAASYKSKYAPDNRDNDSTGHTDSTIISDGPDNGAVSMRPSGNHRDSTDMDVSRNNRLPSLEPEEKSRKKKDKKKKKKHRKDRDEDSVDRYNVINEQKMNISAQNVSESDNDEFNGGVKSDTLTTEL